MTRKFTNKVATGATVMAVALMGLGTTSAAFAQVDPEPGEALASTVSDSPIYSLNIHKFTPGSKSTDERNAQANGTELNPSADLPDAKPITGVVFHLYRVQSLTTEKMRTNEGWQEAANLSKAFNAAGDDADAKATLGQLEDLGTLDPTSTQGIAIKNGLNAGLYYVVEEKPSDITAIKVGNKNLSEQDTLLGSKPFVVTLPMTNPTSQNEWMNTVHVYPKNTQAGINKTVNDEAANGSGSEAESAIVYTVKTDIPEKDALERYEIIDPLDARLKYIDSATLTIENAPETALEAGQEEGKTGDYYIVVTEKSDVVSTTEAPKTGTYLTVVFTEQGLGKLAEAKKAHSNAKVVWTINTQLKSLNENKNDIPNQASFIPDLPNTPENQWDPKVPGDDEPKIPGVPSEKVISKYGTLKLKKIDSISNEALNGAQFQLFACNLEGEHQGNAIKVGGVDTFESGKVYDATNNAGAAGAEGELVVKGLHLNDFQNNSTNEEGQFDPENSYYCLVEKKAPEGHELLAKEIQFQILQGDANYTKSLDDVKNSPKNNGFNLPVTGGAGIATLVGAGVLLIAGSGAYAMAAGRKRKQA